MRNNVLCYLEETARRYPDKTAYTDSGTAVTFSGLRRQAMAVATEILNRTEGRINRPVAVFLPKGVACLTAFFGATYGADFYTPLDVTSPKARLQKIMETLKPEVVITSRRLLPLALSLGFPEGSAVLVEEASAGPADEERIRAALARKIDTDPLYVLFTSGSTGVPKGVTICHRSVLDYIDWACETFRFDAETRFGNQAPFYFDNSILDIYCTLKTGASMDILPENLFMFPVRLTEYLNEKKINTIFWVPSALIYVANSGVLEKYPPKFLKRVLFCGEVMPNKQLNVWRRALPEAFYANLYGPTEITDACAWFPVTREFSDGEPLPIGFPCANTEILVLTEDGKEVRPGETGELCVRGTSLSPGYYGNPEKTSAAFVQNPLNQNYPERIYRTGDLVQYNDRHELMYLCRKDFQIKHMGHRIEIGEIETAVMSLPGMENGCVVNDEAENQIVLFYQSQSLTDAKILTGLRRSLPKYMLPNRCVRLERMPLNGNGKIDRPLLRKSLERKDGQA